MMTRRVLLLVLIVSCAHALVHTFELALPAVEQQIADQYFPDDAARGKLVNGWMAYGWRLPLGIGALVAGFLVDRFGARRMLGIYLIGCGAMCVAVGLGPPLPALFTVMVIMGTFACIYHPAGLALISHETTIDNRARALGIHGIFGSLGIGSAPFMAGAVLTICSWLSIERSWQVFYLVLAVPGIALGIFFIYLHILHRNEKITRPDESTAVNDAEDFTSWRSYFLLAAYAGLMGCTYAGVLAFLPRYMDGANITLPYVPPEGTRNVLAGSVLLIGCLAQYIAGRFARHHLLEIQQASISLSTVPFLLWMAVAEGPWRVVATSCFALIHFMHQPVFNSLISKYTPRSHRSRCYGLCFAMGLGVGSLGAVYAGYFQDNFIVYGTLAGVATISGSLSLILWRWNR